MLEVFNTPVLLIIFNRPETTKQVFDVIRKVKPRQLFIAADGPRINKEGETKRCEDARQIVSNVDWECEVKTFFRKENVGCGRGPSEAISWMFEYVDRGIILEDDCLPSFSFFRFCEELLEKYNNDVRIQMIAGSNLLQEWIRGDQSYHFCLSAGIWGWATWKRAWDKYDYKVEKFKEPIVLELFKNQISNENERLAYLNALNITIEKNGDVSWWDYQWVFSKICNSSFGIIPKVNLIKNIGFGVGATHTIEAHQKILGLTNEELEFPLIHPEKIIVDKEYDLLYSNFLYPESNQNGFLNKTMNFISRKIKNTFLKTIRP